jgi:hypothetical protein
MVVQAALSNDTWTATRLWATNNPASHWMTPVAHDGFLYGQFGIQSFDSPSAQLHCIDMRTGGVRWSVAGFGRGSTIMVDNHLVTLTEGGDLVLSVPTPVAYTARGRFRAIPFYSSSTNRCWNVPAIADGRVYVRSTSYVACFDLSVPDLKLQTPTLNAGGTLVFAVRTTDGLPVNSNRLAAIEVRAATNLAQPLASWARLTNGWTLSNDVIRIENRGAIGHEQYFIVNEPQ